MRSADDDLVSAPTIEPVIPAEQPRRTGVARWIRRLAIPIIVGWIALIAVLNVTVPQLEVVGQMRSVSMSPKEAPSVIAMMRVGKVFEEFDSDSSAMIVLEGDHRLGADAHRFYDDMVDKLRADSKHVEHIQDFWGDPLTSAGAQSEDGKAAYVQVYLRGNMGEALGNESVTAVQELVAGLSPPPGVKVFVTGGPALQADQQIAGDRSVRIIEFGDGHRHHPDAAVLLSVDRHSPARVGDAGVGAVGDPWCGGVPRLPRPDRVVDIRDSAPGNPRDRRNDRLRDLPDRALPGGPHDRGRPGVGLLHDVPRHRPCSAGLGHDDRRSDILPFVHPTALLPDAGHPARGRNGRRSACGADSGARDNHGREPLRTIRAQARHADSFLAAPGRRRRPMAGLDPAHDDHSRPWLAYLPFRATSPATTTESTYQPTCRRTRDSQRPNGISPSPG